MATSLDISDRSLRKVVIGLGGPNDGVPHEEEFAITLLLKLWQYCAFQKI